MIYLFAAYTIGALGTAAAFLATAITLETIALIANK